MLLRQEIRNSQDEAQSARNRDAAMRSVGRGLGLRFVRLARGVRVMETQLCRQLKHADSLSTRSVRFPFPPKSPGRASTTLWLMFRLQLPTAFPCRRQ